jgi:hypothetical protein
MSAVNSPGSLLRGSPEEMQILVAMQELTKRLLKAVAEDALIDLEFQRKFVDDGVDGFGFAVSKATGEWDCSIKVRNPVKVPDEQKLENVS